MRYALAALLMLILSATSAVTRVTVGIGISPPGVSTGINLPSYLQLVLVAGHPVYYRPENTVCAEILFSRAALPNQLPPSLLGMGRRANPPFG